MSLEARESPPADYEDSDRYRTRELEFNCIGKRILVVYDVEEESSMAFELDQDA
jgi:hypothetical protein